MHEYSNEELKKININESLVKGMSWRGAQFQDFVIAIDWCGQEDLQQEIDFLKNKASLYFEFATEFEFNFKFKPGTMGALEITSFIFELTDEIWSIEFTFKFFPVGYIKFKCNNFKFIVDSIEM